MRTFLASFFMLALSLSASLTLKAGVENKDYKSKVLGSTYDINHLIDELPMIALNSQQAITFHFDVKEDYPAFYSYTFVHCDEHWDVSDLVTEEYIDGYVEDNITSSTYSTNTDIPYIHYSLSFPNNNMRITKSGNYALIIYEDGDRNNVLLTRRFYVTENAVNVLIEGIRGNAQEDDLHQFRGEIDVSNWSSSSPNLEFSVRLIKHKNGYSSGTRLNPQYFGNNKITLQPFQNKLEAGNEFRLVDLRSFNQNGQGVFKVVRRDSINHFILYPDAPRRGGYSNSIDHNGSFYWANQNRWESNRYETEYAYAHFYLNQEVPIDSGNIYIYGALTNWNIIPEAKMQYKESSNKYVGELLLKQGVYDYCYVFVPHGSAQLDWSVIEGSYQQTSNDYLLLIYFKPFAGNYQRLIGVKRFQYQN